MIFGGGGGVGFGGGGGYGGITYGSVMLWSGSRPSLYSRPGLFVILSHCNEIPGIFMR